MVRQILSKVIFSFFINFIWKGNKVKCRAEAHAPKLRDFINEFNFRTREEEQRRKIVIVTDDERIKDEMRPYMLKYNFVDPDPAPKRLVDKVILYKIFFAAIDLLCRG